ncbi:MAG: chorismate synthase [Clostridiales bacterium]|nr:chorismate synthase [Clostridiales bacterium]
MSSQTGKILKVSVFGQSHSECIGAVIDGIPAGEAVDTDKILTFMKRRSPGNNSWSTGRKEADIPRIVSGVVDGVTCGSPITVIIENKDTRSSDYDDLKYIPRPSHSDYPAFIKYGEAHDIRGGGHFSGRLTAPLCFAGALCMQILERMGINIGAHISSVGSVDDTAFDNVDLNIDELKSAAKKQFPAIDDTAADKMIELIENAREKGDSVGGTVECGVLGVPAGIGEPMFDGIENRLAAALFGIPAVKGIEFGMGFESGRLYGSENNDGYYFDGEKVKTFTNNSGGIAGGISTGMPLIFRLAFKPTPSIALPQRSVDLRTMKNTELIIHGRHDPCIVPRAVPCVEAVTAITLLDLIYEDKKYGHC